MAKQRKKELPEGTKAPDFYGTAYQTRNLEINLFWQRSNYFLVLNTAVITGIVLKLGSSDPLVGIFIAFGIFVSWLWTRVNLGSKFWQTRWEQKLKDLEMSEWPTVTMFSATADQIIADVEKGLAITPGRGFWRGHVDKHTLKKPSVSRHMMLLSAGFLVLYVALLVLWVTRILMGYAT